MPIASLMLLLLHASFPSASAAAAAAPSYARQIQPLFQRHCMPCHDAATRTSGLSLESYAALMRGGKGGAVIPPGRESGWMIPEGLRGPWHLQLGRSQDVLPGLLDRLGAIDFFLHDSEHSETCMRFEFEHAWAALRPGGVLAADDVTQNTAFADFASAQDREPGGAKRPFQCSERLAGRLPRFAPDP